MYTVGIAHDGEAMLVRTTDIWLFRVGLAVATFFGVSFGCKPLGHYLHEREADQIAHRERADSEAHDDAAKLMDGYGDTKGWEDMKGYLPVEQWKFATAKPHPVEENKEKIAGVAAIVLALLGGESARIWAAKQEAKRRISARRG
jgi:hypothetical protein